MKKFLVIFALLLTMLLVFVSCEGVPSVNTKDSSETTDSTGTSDSTNDSQVPECLLHTYGDWVTTVEATCAKTGIRIRTCSVCGYVKEDVTSLRLHTKQAVGKVEATCTKDGHTSGTNCSVCGAVISGCEPIAAKGHKFQGNECTVCGEPSPVNDAYILLYSSQTQGTLEAALRSCGFGVTVYVENDDMVSKAPNLNEYDIIIFDGVEPVEVPAGKAVWYLDTPSLPGSIGEYGAQDDSQYNNGGISLFANTYNKIGKQLTSKVDISEAVVGKYKPLLNLNSAMSPFMMAGTNTVAAAGEIDGGKVIVFGFSIKNSNLALLITDYIILVYNMVEYSILGILPEAEPCKHAQQSVKGYDATCEKDGLSSSIVCSKCGEVLIPAEVKPAKGHKYDENGVCKNCGKEKTEE